MIGYGKRVLLVDDAETVRELLGDVLVHWEFSVIQACNGLHALSELQNRHFDVVISDVTMPHLNGLDLLRQCRLAWPDLPVILLSGNHNQIATLAAARGAYACLPKPVDTDQLLDLLSSAVGHPVASCGVAEPARSRDILDGAGEAEGRMMTS